LAGTAQIYVERDIRLLWEADQFVVELGSASPRRHSSLQIHELAHAILYSVLCHPLTADAFKRRYAHRLKRETFCNNFMRDLLLPKSKRDSITLQMADELLSASDRKVLRDSEDQAGLRGITSLPRLTFQHIRALAGRFDVSMRCLISGLYKHPLMDQAACGLVVMRMCANRVTGQQVGLRIWQMARTSWGFVILNQRVARQGFLNAADVCHGGRTGQTVFFNERLRVTLEGGGAGGHRNERVELPTVCAYTPVDVQQEGRYVVAIWSWLRPIVSP
jgi:hypothetical protein